MCCAIKRGLKFSSVHDQGTEIEFTVVQKLNQGSHPKKGCNFFRGSFFAERPDERSDFGSTFFACPDERSGTRGRSKKVK